MNNGLEIERIQCPYCGESLEIYIEALEHQQRYFEDCQVCCQPILIEITPDIDHDRPLLRYFSADEVP